MRWKCSTSSQSAVGALDRHWPRCSLAAALGDYLTSQGQSGEADRAMIADAGFVIEGADQPTLPDHHHDLVITRHSGAGTTTPVNT